MGYIAPIRMIQYAEYQKRDGEKIKNHDPMPVNFTPRITLQPKLQLGTHTAAILPKLKDTRQKEGEADAGSEIIFNEQGKGCYINEYV